ncbi:MAG: KpsF/GutQ family sugar-phosphate isomerase [Phycisphaerales bacterium]
MPGSAAKPTNPAHVRPPQATPEVDLARAALRVEAAALSAIADRLAPGSPQAHAFVLAVDLIVTCADAGGTVLVTGLGKSGIIGAKIAATLSSLGIASHAVHPTEAAHGDLGRFRPADCCIAISYSGESDEVVALASILRQDSIPIITITKGSLDRAGHLTPSSSLERLATAALFVGHIDEAGGLTPAPTTSTTATLGLGDALALAACRRRNFTSDDFAKRHPGGTLGGMLRPVADALRFTIGKNLAPIPDDLSVADALKQAESMVRRPGALLLVARTSGALTGIFTDADLRRLILRDSSHLSRPIRDLMTREPATLPASALVRDAVNLVRESRRDEIPVIDDAGKPIGILDVQDLIAMRLIQDA